jgi:hypothetical protein
MELEVPSSFVSPLVFSRFRSEHLLSLVKYRISHMKNENEWQNGSYSNIEQD